VLKRARRAPRARAGNSVRVKGAHGREKGGAQGEKRAARTGEKRTPKTRAAAASLLYAGRRTPASLPLLASLLHG
jgi:hypothetical protein